MTRNRVDTPVKRIELEQLETKLLKRLRKVEDKQESREDKDRIAEFISKTKIYAESKGLCPKCDGKMKVKGRETVRFAASNRLSEHSLDMGGLSFEIPSFKIPIGDDKREILKLACEDCQESLYMFCKQEN